MTIAGQKVALLADPEALTTRLERAACWTCHDESEGELDATRMGRAIREFGRGAGPRPSRLSSECGAHARRGPGRFRHRRPLPKPEAARSQRSSLASSPRSPHVPVALSISGLWLIHHFDDFRWLVGERNSGALDILWTDHTYHHPYHRKLPDDANFLLSKGVDPRGGNPRHRAASHRQRRDPVAVLPLPRSHLQRSADAGR